MTDPDETKEARERRAGIVALVVVQFCFGLFPVFGKLALDAFEAVAVAGWRMGVGALILGGQAFLVHGRRAIPTFRDLVRLQVCALLGISINQVLYLKGLDLAPAVNAALIMCLIPVFTLIVAVAARQEAFVARRFIGTAIAFIGTAALIFQRGLDLGDAYLRGNLLMCANALSYSIYLVYSRPLSRRYPPSVVIGWVFILSTWQVPLFLGDAPLVPEVVSPGAWGSLAFVLVFPTTLAYFLNIFALSRVSASTTAIFIFSQPIIAAVASALILDEDELPALTIVSAVVIFFGIRLTAAAPRRRL